MRALTLKEMLGSEEVRRRRYLVEGEIIFVFKPPRDMSSWIIPPKLEVEIALADHQFPWKEEGVFEDQRCAALRRYLGSAIINDARSMNVPVGEQHVRFHIVPYHSGLRKDQVYAYEKYLAKLAEELAKKKLCGSSSVHSVIRVSAKTTFEVTS